MIALLLLTIYSGLTGKLFFYRIPAKYRVGDIVRVSKYGLFKRSYDESFDVNLFYIHEVLTRLPRPMYRLRKPSGEVTDDVYYQEEIQRVNLDNWKVQEVLKKRRYRGRPQSLIHWQGWPREQATWVNDSDITGEY